MPRLRGKDLRPSINPAVNRVEPGEGEALVVCPLDDCDWQTVRPDRDRVVWSAQEAHRIRHQKGLV